MIARPTSRHRRFSSLCASRSSFVLPLVPVGAAVAGLSGLASSSAIQAVVGAAAGNAVPLLSIVPTDHRLEAHLYGPSRSIGFVQPGQRVLVRYPAFPYQRFGHHEGVVASVSRTAVSPADLPAPLPGISAGSSGSSSGGNAEPIYRIVVELASQGVTAYGQTMALQPGMTLFPHVMLGDMEAGVAAGASATTTVSVALSPVPLKLVQDSVAVLPTPFVVARKFRLCASFTANSSIFVITS